jgi:hypothetical protein
MRIELLFTSLLMISILFTSCNKDDKPVIPVISLVADTATIHTDTCLSMGDNMKFVIAASSENIPLTNLVVSCGESVYLDSGLYTNNMLYELNVVKGSSPSETWSFVVMNKDRQIKSVSVTITLSDSSDFNPVITHTGIRMGAQDNSLYGSFYSADSNTVHFMQSACTNQDVIDIIYYYGTYECTLSSPNETEAPAIFTGSYGLAEWTVKNESRYFLTSLSVTDFDQISNDSILIASYNPVGSTRKGKNVVPGQVWSFRLHTGKLGLMYVSETQQGTDGSLLFSLKVQQ